MQTDTNHKSRLELLSPINVAALICIERWGVETAVGNISGKVKMFTSEAFEICYRTPSSGVLTESNSFGIDIWINSKKVFSTGWNSDTLKDYELITLSRGPWIPALLKLAASHDGGLADYP